MSKERPILFSAPMVRAILEGRKTQTRRIIKPQPVLDPETDERIVNAAWQSGHVDVSCPYGKVGNRLWVRETFREAPADQDGNCTEYRADRPEYQKRDDDPSAIPWTPSIHMPRCLSRIMLEITGVRVERLQDISREDAIAEGLSFAADGGASWGVPGDAASWWNDPRRSYQQLWTSINGAPSWFSNPWVWVVEFKRLSA